LTIKNQEQDVLSLFAFEFICV